MVQFSGKTIFPGVAFGSAAIFIKREISVDVSNSDDPNAEWTYFLEAVKTANCQLTQLFKKTRQEIGKEEALIIDVQRMMLEDDDYLEAINRLIFDKKSRAAYAVEQVSKQIFDQFAALSNHYMQARASDILDISRRLVTILTKTDTVFKLLQPSIVIAEDLTPSETLSLDKNFIQAFVTRRGAVNSHTAILARILRIPSIIQVEIPLDMTFNGISAAVDAHNGLLYLEPDEAVKKQLNKQEETDKIREHTLKTMIGLPTETKSGKKIRLAANIGNVEDLELALANDAEGIGIFRSEFLYMCRCDYPNEEEQLNAYKAVAQAMNGKQVVIRTLDIGADKQVDYFGIPAEENPAMGYRAIRICLERTEMFKTQLRAIYRAAAFGNVAMIIPMITSVWELRRCKELAAEAKEELKKEGKTTGEVAIGVMIETPAAALCADDLARESAFFSVGTNDLTQYTLAIDRQNAGLDKYLDIYHPAILKLLKIVAESAHNAGIVAGICGELASDPQMTAAFIDMGYKELSVSPPFILGLRKKIREME
jgi:phosphotransferase system enzyme I (PtsI)